MTDFTVMVEGTSYMFVTGPGVVRAVTHEVVDRALGGMSVHTGRSGVAHLAARDRRRRWTPSVACCAAPEQPRRCAARHDDRAIMDVELDAVVPDEPSKPYDMHDVLRRVVDDGDVLEIQRHGPRTSSLAARLGGRAVGLVAQQPAVAPARSTSMRRSKPRGSSAHDAFNIPLVTFVDVPGFLPGSPRSTADHPARREAAVRVLRGDGAKVTVITRKAYGGAYDVMSSKHIRGDFNVAWPTAEIAVMGAEGAVNIIFKDSIDGAEDPDAERRRLVAEYETEFSNPYVAAARGYIDEVIFPRETRPRLIRALEVLANKQDTNPRKKHGNIPL
jgi:propionyl-CoA carboxylase beta chain